MPYLFGLALSPMRTCNHLSFKGGYYFIGRGPLSLINQIQQIAESHGRKCLSGSCNSLSSVLWWECDKGHRWQATPSRIRAVKNWCSVCAEKPNGTTIEDMKSLAKDRGGRCLSEAYKGSLTKLLWECSEGHQWKTTPTTIKNGSWCPICSRNKQLSKTRLTIDAMQTLAKKRDGECLSEVYTNNRTKLLWECREGHTWEATPHGIKKGTWCPECYVSLLIRRKQERSE
jgi:hypothetical protein